MYRLDSLYIKCVTRFENGFHGGFPKIMFISQTIQTSQNKTRRSSSRYMGFLPVLSNASQISSLNLWNILIFSYKLSRGKFKFGASWTHARYLVWHCFWSGAVYPIYTVLYSRTCLYIYYWMFGDLEVRIFSSLCNQGRSVGLLLHKAIFHCGRRYICSNVY